MVTYRYSGADYSLEFIFTEVNCGRNEGTAADVSAYADSGGAANVYLKGLLYETGDVHFDIEEAVLNIRQNN